MGNSKKSNTGKLLTTLKTPGVYIAEKNVFPNSIIAIETAIPAFIGYTEKAEFEGESLKNKPIRIESLMDYESYFGSEFQTKYDLNNQNPRQDPLFASDFTINSAEYWLSENKDNGPSKFNLYDALKFFYQNGGGSCYIISVGFYTDTGENMPFSSTQAFYGGIDALNNEIEPTMIVIPDAVLFEQNSCYSIQEKMLMHCGEQMNRVAILDIWEGYKGLENPNFNPINEFRDHVSSDFFSYGAAYYPWLHTTIIQPSEINYNNLSDEGRKVLVDEICKPALPNNLNEKKLATISKYLESVKDGILAESDKINNALSIVLPEYKLVMKHLLLKENVMAPSAAMAGIYTLVDAERGVWKAPANVAVSSVFSPTVDINHEQQGDLNAPLQGKAICAIRQFKGIGTMVWGARTLDANSLDWRYINVRRTMIMLEQSIKMAVKTYIFEPNVKNTWLSIEAMITNFLTNLWKQGALAGAKPNDAFGVKVGLGTTMTATDVLEGKMSIEVKVAISHPAEFIVIMFQQQQHKS